MAVRRRGPGRREFGYLRSVQTKHPHDRGPGEDYYATCVATCTKLKLGERSLRRLVSTHIFNTYICIYYTSARPPVSLLYGLFRDECSR